MATRTSVLEDARTEARKTRVEIGAEVRLARTSAGASLREAGDRVGMSHTQLRRIERGEVASVSVDQLSRACWAVGLRMVARAVPGAGPAVDEAQLALLGRFRAVLPPGSRLATEVPLPSPGDLRAWDGLLVLDGARIAIEAETRLRDAQSLERRYAIKMRDGRIDLLLLLVSDTAHNREFLDMHREALRVRFPLGGRQLLPDLRSGRAPKASGILVL